MRSFIVLILASVSAYAAYAYCKPPQHQAPSPSVPLFVTKPVTGPTVEPWVEDVTQRWMAARESGLPFDPQITRYETRNVATEVSEPAERQAAPARIRTANRNVAIGRQPTHFTIAVKRPVKSPAPATTKKGKP